MPVNGVRSDTVTTMKKHPVVMALLTLGAIFIFFLLIAVGLTGLLERRSALSLGGAKVGVIEVVGVIEDPAKIIEDLIDFRDDGSVKAIILRVDSPGGGVAPSQEIHEEVKKAQLEKPIVVSIASVAASGGYYIAAPAQKIMANPGSITGSIGVIMEFTNYQDLLGKIGLRNEVVKSGAHKDIGSAVRPMTEADRRILQSMIGDVHEQFIAAVAEGRGLDPVKVRELADGRIFTGRQARSVGLVDELGNLEDAIELAASLAGIDGEPNVVYPPRDKPKFLEYLVQETVSQLSRGLRGQGAGLQFLWSGIQ